VEDGKRPGAGWRQVLRKVRSAVFAVRLSDPENAQVQTFSPAERREQL